MNGLRMPALLRRVSPKRGFTSYLNVFDAASKPRTYSSVGSRFGCCPQPCTLLLPCVRMSTPVSTFETPMRNVARCGKCSAEDTRLTCMFWMLKNQGAWELLRLAALFTWLRRQSFCGEVANTCSSCVFIVGSVTFAGSK